VNSFYGLGILNMQNEPYEGMLSEYLKGEMRVINAHVPVQQKSLAELMKEEYPGVLAKDGSTYLIKRKELNYLAGFLTPEEQKQLVLPLLIEVVPGEDYIAVIARSKIEAKVVEYVLGMPVRIDRGRIEIVKPQLAVLRQNLRTATQYIFSPRMPS
jgi:uncharacterized protein (UPF0216 family)